MRFAAILVVGAFIGLSVLLAGLSAPNPELEFRCGTMAGLCWAFRDQKIGQAPMCKRAKQRCGHYRWFLVPTIYAEFLEDEP